MLDGFERRQQRFEFLLAIVTVRQVLLYQGQRLFRRFTRQGQFGKGVNLFKTRIAVKFILMSIGNALD